MVDDRSLAGRCAVITGGSRGLGRAIALALADAGVSRIGLVARVASELEAAASEVRDAGAEVVTLVSDLSDGEELSHLDQRIFDDVGDVDILINNAATVRPLGPTLALSQEELAVAFRLNALAPIMLGARMAGQMMRRRWGRIVNLSSGIVANASGAVGSGAYLATKAAVEAHTIAFAAELEGTGVTVNAYRPGLVDTGMQEWVRAQDPADIGEQLHRRFVDSHSSGLLLPPQRSADALVVRLGSDETGGVWSAPAHTPSPPG